MKVSCEDHNGHNKAFMAQWDGTKYVKGSDWIEPMKDKVRPLIERPRKEYAARTPVGRSAPSLRQVELISFIPPRDAGRVASERERVGSRLPRAKTPRPSPPDPGSGEADRSP